LLWNSTTSPAAHARPTGPYSRITQQHLDDPAGKGVEAVRPIRDEIRDRVQVLIGELRAAGASA